MIRAILFDFGNVICKFDVGIFLKRFSELSGIPLQTLKDQIQQASAVVKQYETGLLTSDEFFDRMVSGKTASIAKSEFIKAYTDIFTPIASTVELIRRLKPHYKLGLLSNTSEWHYQHGIRQVEVFPLFDAVTLSFEVKALKPSEIIYRDALAKLQTRPDETVYIDDIPEYVEAATTLGIRSTLYTSHDELIDSLRRFNVVI